MAFFTRTESRANLERCHQRYKDQLTSAQPQTDCPIRILANHPSYRCHQKQNHQIKRSRRRFRVARLAEAPNFAQQQTQIVGGTFDCVHFDHIVLAPQPTAPSTSCLADVREGSLAALASPPVQTPSLLPTHPSSVGPKRRL